jgi:hypothetical protein
MEADLAKKKENKMLTYATMPTKNAEEDWIKGLLLFGSDYARAYLGAYESREDRSDFFVDWHMIGHEEKSKMIEEKMPSPSDGGWQNKPYLVIAPDIMAAKTDALGRVWRAQEAYESRSRNTTLVRYRGVSSDVYGYEYVELVISEYSSFRDLPICSEWAYWDVSFEDIIEFLDK